MKINLKLVWLIVAAGTALALAMALAPVAFAVTPPSPDAKCQLQPSSMSPLWASYNDYRDRRLTVHGALQNTAGIDCAVDIDSVEADNGVTVETPMPIGMGHMPAASSHTFNVRFLVPPGINLFRINVHALGNPVPPAPVNDSDTMSIDPPAAYANAGCPADYAPSVMPLPLPEDQTFGPRTFTVTIKDAFGNHVAGRGVAWSVTNDLFKIDKSSGVTDANGQAFAVVIQPTFYFFTTPYAVNGYTYVEASSPDMASVSAVFGHAQCAS